MLLSMPLVFILLAFAGWVQILQGQAGSIGSDCYRSANDLDTSRNKLNASESSFGQAVENNSQWKRKREPAVSGDIFNTFKYYVIESVPELAN